MSLLLSLPRALAQWSFLFVCNVVLLLLGLVVVAVALPFRVPGVSVSDGRPIVNLPRWAWLWGNDFDGVLGDKHGTWAASTPFGWPAASFGAMYTWAALRNPVNNMRRLSLFACPVAQCTISGYGQDYVRDSDGQSGWQFVIARCGLRRWYGFYWVHQWTTARALVVRLGYKIAISDAGVTEEPIGMTTKLDLYKAI
ncbi:DUF7338 family protein [Pseudomonas fluorescens group sp. PF-69]